MSNPPPGFPLGYETDTSVYLVPIAGRAKMARIAMIVALFGCVAGGAVLPLEAPARALMASPDRTKAVEMIVMGGAMVVGGCFQSVSLIVSSVFFLMWVHRANRAARHLTQVPLKITPGWAVGWWFVPFANLVLPYQAMKEIWQASGVGNVEEDWRSAPVPGKLLAWWLLYLCSGFVQETGTLLANPQFGGMPGPGTAIAEVGLVMLIVAGILCLQIMKEISANLQARETQLPPMPATQTQVPPAPPSMFP